ncbi:nucleotidyltransferase family protein [soil metagenome]
MIAAVVLAGGESRRMGAPKLALELEGRALLARAVETASQVASSVVVVVGAYAELYAPLAETAGARVVVNPDWREGLASSLRVGVAALPPQTEAALVLLGDQPLVPVEHFEKMLAVHRADAVTLVFSSYDGVRGAPTLIDASLFGAVQTLTGDTGARALQRGARVAEVPSAEAFDVDTPDDAARLNLTPVRARLELG